MDGEFLDLEAQEITILGTPWHGPVKGGQITLPGALSRAYPQPSPRGTLLDASPFLTDDVAGNCHRLVVPDVPAVVRSPEEAAADTAAGYQWRTEATLAGGRLQINGHEVRGWIYVDENKDRWLVTCTALWPDTLYNFSAGFSATLTLTRFGLIPMGGAAAAADAYPHAVNLADWGQDGHTAEQGRIVLEALTKTGNKAAFRVVSAGIQHPVGYLEVSISGLGTEAAVTLTLLRTRAQCVTWTPPESIPGESVFVTDWGFVWVAAGATSCTLDRLVGLWYDNTGAVQEVRMELTATRTESLPAPEGNVRTTSVTENGTLRLKVAGTTVDSVALAGTWNNTTTLASGVRTSSVSINVSVGSLSDSYSVSDISQQDAAIDMLILGGIYSGSSPIGMLGVTGLTHVGLIGHTKELKASVLCQSRQAIGLLVHGYNIDNQLAGVVLEGRQVATPSGLRGDVVAPESLDHKFGSYEPATGNVSLWNDVPVCFV